MTLYRTIVADPPWAVKRGPASLHACDDPNCQRPGHRRTSASGLQSRTLTYETMTVDAIASLRVPAARDAHLYLWTINSRVEDTYAIARAWGFTPSTLLVWAKQPSGRGLGGTFSTCTEYVLFARRGSLRATGRIDRNWWQWKRGPHSAKPEAFLDIVEQVSPGPYLEMFARRNRFGWDTWGNEALNLASGAFEGAADISGNSPSVSDRVRADSTGGQDTPMTNEEYADLARGESA